MAVSDEPKKDEVVEDEKDPKLGDPADQSEGATPEDLAKKKDDENVDPAAELETLRKQLSKVNRESADRRKKLEEFERKENEAKLSQLSAEEQLKVKLKDIEIEKDKIAAELNSTKLSQSFDAAVKELEIEFVTPRAKEDALEFLKKDEKFAPGTAKDLLQSLSKERSYLVKPKIEKPAIDSKDKGEDTKTTEISEARKAELKQRIPSL